MQLHRPYVLLVRFIPFLPVLFIAALGNLFMSGPAHAELLTIMAEGEYRMGDRDTREDAVRLAVEAAKRNALEQVATYIESVTVTNALDITRDEIRSYTAGIVNVVEQHVGTRLEGDTVIIHVEITGQIDDEEVAQAIRTLRGNDDAREQVKILRTEVDELHRQLDDATARLSAAMSPERQQLLTQQRQDLLDRIQSDQLLAQAWTDWAAGGPAIGGVGVQGLWGQAWAVNPGNPHLVVLQRVFPAVVRVTAPIYLNPSRRLRTTPAVGMQVVPRTSSTPVAPMVQQLNPLFRQVPSVQPVPSHRPPFSFSRPFQMPRSPAPRFGGGGHGGHRGGRR